jgi:hypothetical protein
MDTVTIDSNIIPNIIRDFIFICLFVFLGESYYNISKNIPHITATNIDRNAPLDLGLW